MKSHDIIKEREEKRLAELKKNSKPADVKPLFELIKKLGKEGSEVDRLLLKSKIAKSFEESGNHFLERAFLEKILTEDEWIKIRNKYNFSMSDIGVILMPIFNKMDGYAKKTDKTIIMTMPESLIYKHKDFIKKRFKVEVKSMEEIMQKERGDIKCS